TGDATAPAWATEHATALAAALGPRHAALRQALEHFDFEQALQLLGGTGAEP
ncbi:hypothetical protein HA630_04245, partial [Aquabacterium sp. A08]|nr:hypothetical protein [Aquabacterium sp. A08]